MSEPKHSSEPWCVGCWAGNLIHEKGGANIAETALDDVGAANAARIVACVNFCAGVPLEFLEDGNKRTGDNEISGLNQLRGLLNFKSKLLEEYRAGYTSLQSQLNKNR